MKNVLHRKILGMSAPTVQRKTNTFARYKVRMPGFHVSMYVLIYYIVLEVHFQSLQIAQGLRPDPLQLLVELRENLHRNKKISVLAW